MAAPAAPMLLLLHAQPGPAMLLGGPSPLVISRPELRDGMWRRRKSDEAGPSDAPRRLLVRGLFNSGTNFVQQLINRNLNTMVYDYWPHANRSASQPYPFGCHKHTPLQLISPAAWDPLPVQAGWLSVIVLRHPLQWLASMRKAHYNVFCRDWCALTRCSHQLPRASLLCAAPGGSLRYERLESAWAEWVSAIDALCIPHVVLRYEDALLRPFDVLAAVAAAANATFRAAHADAATIDVVEDAAKRHGRAAGRAQKLQELRTARPGDTLRTGEAAAVSCAPNNRRDSRLVAAEERRRGGGASAAAAKSASARRQPRTAALDAVARSAGAAAASVEGERILSRVGADDTFQSLCQRWGYVCGASRGDATGGGAMTIAGRWAAAAAALGTSSLSHGGAGLGAAGRSTASSTQHRDRQLERRHCHSDTD